MQRILTLLAIFYLGLAGVNAQEQGIYRHYSIYPTLINPGATDFRRVGMNFWVIWSTLGQGHLEPRLIIPSDIVEVSETMLGLDYN